MVAEIDGRNAMRGPSLWSFLLKTTVKEEENDLILDVAKALILHSRRDSPLAILLSIYLLPRCLIV